MTHEQPPSSLIVDPLPERGRPYRRAARSIARAGGKARHARSSSPMAAAPTARWPSSRTIAAKRSARCPASQPASASRARRSISPSRRSATVPTISSASTRMAAIPTIIATGWSRRHWPRVPIRSSFRWLTSGSRHRAESGRRGAEFQARHWRLASTAHGARDMDRPRPSCADADFGVPRGWRL